MVLTAKHSCTAFRRFWTFLRMSYMENESTTIFLMCIAIWDVSLLPNYRCTTVYAVSTARLSLAVLRLSRTRSITLRDWGTLTMQVAPQKSRCHVSEPRRAAADCVTELCKRLINALPAISQNTSFKHHLKEHIFELRRTWVVALRVAMCTHWPVGCVIEGVFPTD